MQPRKLKFYYKLNLYFSIILLICIISMAGVLYYFSANAVDEEIHKANVNSLNYIVKNMEISLKSIDYLSSQIAINPDITYFARNEFHKDYLKLDQLTRNMDSHKMTNPLVHSIYLYYRDGSSIISSPDGKVDIENFGDTDWIDKLSYRIQPEWIFNRRIQSRSDNQSNVNVLTFVRYLPVGSLHPEGAVLINIDVRELQKLYQRSDESASRIIVFNEHHEKVFSNVDGELEYNDLLQSVAINEQNSGYGVTELEGKPFTLAYSTGTNGWQYFMVSPTFRLMSMRSIFAKIILICTIIILIIGFQLAFIFSNRLYNPIRKLMGTVNMDSGSALQNRPHVARRKFQLADEFGIIQNSFSTLKQKNVLLEEKSNKSMDYAVERIVLGLLNGSVMLKDVKDFGMDMHLGQSSRYMVIVLEMDDYKDMIESFTDEYLFDMQCFILNAFDEFYSICEINFLKSVSTSPHQCACLLAFKSGDDCERLLLDQVFSVCDHIRKEVNREYDISVTIGFSMPGKSAVDIYGLYRQANNAVRHRIFQGKNCVQYYGQINFWEKSAFIYPRKQEEDIVKSLFSLDRQKVSVAIQAFADYIRECKVLDHNQVYYIFAQLFGSIIKAAYELGGSTLEVWEGVDIYQKLSCCNYLGEIKELLIFVTNNYIRYFEEKKNSRYKTIVQAAIEYMEANYKDDQLSLANISEKVYLSSSHFEKVFKDIAGKSVMDYLNIIRMEKAKMLLRDSNLKIEAVGEKVGYQTSKGFIRAFKKYENITPGQYRQNLLTN